MNAVAELPEQITSRSLRRPNIKTSSSADVQMTKFRVPEEVPVFEFEVDGFVKRLSKPVTLRVSWEAGKYFVENDTLALFGTGDSLRDAVSEFLQDLAYFWDYYSSLDEDSVTGHGARLKQIYEGLST
jgi:hypothetical protein